MISLTPLVPTILPSSHTQNSVSSFYCLAVGVYICFHQLLNEASLKTIMLGCGLEVQQGIIRNYNVCSPTISVPLLLPHIRRDKQLVEGFVVGLVSLHPCKGNLVCLQKWPVQGLQLSFLESSQAYPHRFLGVSVALGYYLTPEQSPISSHLSQYSFPRSLHEIPLVPILTHSTYILVTLPRQIHVSLLELYLF